MLPEVWQGFDRNWQDINCHRIPMGRVFATHCYFSFDSPPQKYYI